MPFIIKSADKEKVVLERANSGCITAFVFIVCGLFAIVGSLIFLASLLDSKGDLKMLYGGLACAGLGTIGIYSYIFYLKQLKRNVPESLVFDNQHGWVKIDQDKISSQTAFIPYDEIEKFDIRKQRNNNDKGRNSYTYFAIFIKKDGGIWDLVKANNEKSILPHLEKLQQYVDLKQASQKIPDPRLSEKLIRETRSDKALIKWKNPVLASIIQLIISAALIYLIIYSFIQLALIDNSPFVAKLLLGIFAALITLSVGIKAYQLYKDSFTIYGVSVSKLNLEYFEENVAGQILDSNTIPINDIHGIVFNFKNASPEEFIQIETNVEYQIRKQEMNDTFSLENFKNSLGINSGKTFLKTRALNTLEKLQLENWLQKAMGKKL